MAGSGITTLLQINDTHGYLEPHQEMFWNGSQAVFRITSGYARISALFQQVRQEQRGE